MFTKVMTTFPIRIKDPALPKGWSFSVATLCKIRLLWKISEKATLYRNPKNFLSLLAGQILHFTLQKSSLVKLAAFSLLAVRRLQALEQQLSLTKKSYKNLSEIASNFFGSPEQGKTKRTLFRIKVTAKATTLFLKNSVDSTLKITDVVDTLTQPNSKEAITEVFVNSVENATWLSKHKEGLVKAFKQHHITIKKVFNHLGVAVTVEEVTSCLETSLNTLDKVASATKGFNEKNAKKAFFGCATTFGVEHLLPDQMVEEKETLKEYFIPNEIIRLKCLDKRNRFKYNPSL